MKMYRVIAICALLLSMTVCSLAENEISREDYIANPDLFVCNWEHEFTAPDWLHDYDEKVASVLNPDGRLMIMQHRGGDWYHYPENSIEAIISSIRMGADALELDVAKTKDNVLVLMHATYLNATTDVAEKAGKNGLPDSYDVCDWTYEQLLELRLLEGDGQNGQAPKTEYLIPTMEEVLTVCKGRIMVILDKIDRFSWQDDMYPLVKKLEAWDTCMVYDSAVIDDFVADTGKAPLLFYQGMSKGFDATMFDWAAESLAKKGIDHRLVYWDDISKYKPGKYLSRFGESYSKWQGKMRFIVAMNRSGGVQNELGACQELMDYGSFMVLLDDGLAAMKYVAETYGPQTQQPE